MYDHCYGYGTPTYAVGVTTETQYTTVPPSPVMTMTSNGVVVVVMDTGSYVAQPVGATDQVQVVSEGALPVRISGAALSLSIAVVGIVGLLMVVL